MENLKGNRFGRWLVLEHDGYGPSGTIYKCLCDCGAEKSVLRKSLLNGRSISCGCYAKEKRLEANTKHGHSGKKGGQSPTYKTWAAMKRRCSDKNHRSKASYYDKGITVCERWKDFKNFLADMGERPEGSTIDRIDGNGNYEPSNCRWSTPKEQANNMKTNHYIERDGLRLTVSQWAEKLGIKDGTIRARLSRGWSDERALGF